MELDRLDHDFVERPAFRRGKSHHEHNGAHNRPAEKSLQIGKFRRQAAPNVGRHVPGW